MDVPGRSNDLAGTSPASGRGWPVALWEALADFLAAVERWGRWPGKLRGGKPVEVINTAVSGYNTAMEVETLIDKGLQFEPDLVVYLQASPEVLFSRIQTRNLPPSCMVTKRSSSRFSRA